VPAALRRRHRLVYYSSTVPQPGATGTYRRVSARDWIPCSRAVPRLPRCSADPQSCGPRAKATGGSGESIPLMAMALRCRVRPPHDGHVAPRASRSSTSRSAGWSSCGGGAGSQGLELPPVSRSMLRARPVSPTTNCVSDPLPARIELLRRRGLRRSGLPHRADQFATSSSGGSRRRCSS